ncbi:MAG: hypothetical protein OXE44_17305 [Nitrospinae bacterium]|nr:hypothetical protein [Nitrospinota bacterium]
MKNQKPSTKALVLVLCGPLLAFIFTLHVLAGGGGSGFLPEIWFWAVLWTFLAALAGVLWRAYRGDRSAFAGYELPEGDGDRFDWSTRTGRYAWRRDDEEGELHAHDDFSGHGPIT